jgi:hydrogenase assembly chaperone HypC/HupF
MRTGWVELSMTETDRALDSESSMSSDLDPTSLRCDLPDDGGHCITCGDEALPLRVVKIDEARDLALCEAEGGERESVEIALVSPVIPGDTLLVHAGTAIAKLPGEAAA